jgi:hypothetical protein
MSYLIISHTRSAPQHHRAAMVSKVTARARAVFSWWRRQRQFGNNSGGGSSGTTAAAAVREQRRPRQFGERRRQRQFLGATGGAATVFVMVSRNSSSFLIPMTYFAYSFCSVLVSTI